MGIVEIVRSLTDKEAIEKDMTEAILLVSAIFHERYVDKLKKELKDRYDNHHKNPSRELNLIKSIKPFLKEEKHIMHCNKAIDMVNKFDTARGIHHDVRNHRHNERNHHNCDDYTYTIGHAPSNHGYHHHHDGHHDNCRDVYEIDRRCRCKKNLGKVGIAAAIAYLIFR